MAVQRLVAVALLVAVTAVAGAHLRGQTIGQRAPAFKASTELVLVNVVVRDRTGAIVRGLTKDDFAISEDGKRQTIQTFDAEDLGTSPNVAALDAVKVLGGALKAVPSPSGPAASGASSPAGPAPDLRGRRLVVLFFDLSSMQTEELERAVVAARDYLTKQLSAVDLVAIASFSTALRVDQDFTADREALLNALNRFNTAGGQGFEEGATGDSEGTPDNGAAFTVDDTEFNIFNTDRRLQALQTLSEALSGIDQKKSIVYFSSGMSQSGQDNQVQLRRTVDRAVRSNVSIYASDARGLQAIVPGGESRQASLRGQAPFSGTSVGGQFDSLAGSQDTLTTIAEDTGGRAFFDTNDLGGVFTQVIRDTSSYYVLAYASTNPARDGRYRRISVKTTRPGLKVEYRAGYYAGRDFAHSSRKDREAQLEDQLLSDLSATDLSAYLSAAAFRLSDKRSYVSLSIVVPGYQIPVNAKTESSRASLDVLGVVEDKQKRPVGQIRDTVHLASEGLADLQRKIVQYETGLELAPGTYRVKVVVRENVLGTYGSYESDLQVPDLKASPLKLSSVVIGTQLQAGAHRDDKSPLAQNGQKLVPNITHVVSAGQHLYFYYEVYEPGGTSRTVKLVTSLTFFRGRVRAFETPPIETNELSAPDRQAAVFRFDLPPGALPPGLYTCQVNVVDDGAGAFVFPRFQLFVRK